MQASIAGTDLADRKTDLLTISRLDPEKQAQVVAAVQAGSTVKDEIEKYTPNGKVTAAHVAQVVADLNEDLAPIPDERWDCKCPTCGAPDYKTETHHCWACEMPPDEDENERADWTSPEEDPGPDLTPEEEEECLQALEAEAQEKLEQAEAEASHQRQLDRVNRYAQEAEVQPEEAMLPMSGIPLSQEYLHRLIVQLEIVGPELVKRRGIIQDSYVDRIVAASEFVLKAFLRVAQ